MHHDDGPPSQRRRLRRCGGTTVPTSFHIGISKLGIWHSLKSHSPGPIPALYPLSGFPRGRGSFVAARHSLRQGDHDVSCGRLAGRNSLRSTVWRCGQMRADTYWMVIVPAAVLCHSLETIVMCPSTKPVILGLALGGWLVGIPTNRQVPASHAAGLVLPPTLRTVSDFSSHSPIRAGKALCSFDAMPLWVLAARVTRRRASSFSPYVCAGKLEVLWSMIRVSSLPSVTW